MAVHLLPPLLHSTTVCQRQKLFFNGPPRHSITIQQSNNIPTTLRKILPFQNNFPDRSLNPIPKPSFHSPSPSPYPHQLSPVPPAPQWDQCAALSRPTSRRTHASPVHTPRLASTHRHVNLSLHLHHRLFRLPVPPVPTLSVHRGPPISPFPALPGPISKAGALRRPRLAGLIGKSLSQQNFFRGWDITEGGGKTRLLRVCRGEADATSLFMDARTWGRTRSPLNWDARVSWAELSDSCHAAKRRGS